MGAPDLLLHLRDAGFSLAVAEDGGIRIAPFSKLSDDHRQAILDHKAELLTLLTDDQPTVDLDRWCWPHGDAMNTTEIERFLARVKQLIERGIAEDAAERLADELVLADRQPPLPAPSSSSAPATPAQPAARSCAACANLTRRGTCTEPVAAGLAETFGIRWPELGQGAGCAAYCSP
jgi:hypothetical protein